MMAHARDVRLKHPVVSAFMSLVAVTLIWVAFFSTYAARRS